MMVRLAAVLSGPLLLPALLGGGTPFASHPHDERPAPPVVRPAEPDPAAPPGLALFNNPFGPQDRQYALIRHIDAEIDGAEPGAAVRLAAYSFAMPSTAQALIRAHRRGVGVQVVVDGHSGRWRSVRNLRGVLGTDTAADSFVVACRRSCRGTTGNQHAKFVTISRTGSSDDVVMVGSMNFTSYAASKQWQDLYTVAGDAGLYDQLTGVFTLMARDAPQPRLELPQADATFAADVAPLTGAGGDPIARRLGRVACRGATGGTGSHGRTVVRISMHAWNGARGISLARKVARLDRRGCDVRVLAGIGFGPQVTRILRSGGVGYRDSGRAGRHTHEKLMLVSGNFAGQRNATYVWTGSHNWSDRSLRNDEVTLRVDSRRAVAAYRRNFARIWRVAGRG